MTPPVVTKVVPASDPAHPSHSAWLGIVMFLLKAATAIGPAIVTVADPGDAKEAQQIGSIVSSVIPEVPAA